MARPTVEKEGNIEKGRATFFNVLFFLGLQASVKALYVCKLAGGMTCASTRDRRAGECCVEKREGGKMTHP